MEEISTSFCFICLLHLANEQGLKIEVDNQRGREADEFTTEGDVDPGEDKKVGDLWALKVRAPLRSSWFLAEHDVTDG